MAGAISSGTSAGNATRAVVSASSAMPQATLAMMLAVAGTTSAASAHPAAVMCAMGSAASWPVSKRPVSVVWPVRASKVAVPTNFSASAVIVTRTSQPAFCRPRTTSAAL